MPGLILKIKRAETPGYAKAKALILGSLRAHIPFPAFLRPVFRGMYDLHFGASRIARRLYIFFYAEPLLRGRCDHVGQRLFLWSLPVISGHTSIWIGDNVSIFGKIGISSGRMHANPMLKIGNRVSIGDRVGFVVNKEVTVEDDVNIASGCTIQDSDGHPLDHRYRSAGYAPFESEMKPVRICRNAWIGMGCTISKGVTIGEGAIIGSRSVVLTNVPPYARAVGNPARVLLNPGPPKDDFAPLQSSADPAGKPTDLRKMFPLRRASRP